jgi:hypothetical protein
MWALDGLQEAGMTTKARRLRNGRPQLGGIHSSSTHSVARGYRRHCRRGVDGRGISCAGAFHRATGER